MAGVTLRGITKTYGQDKVPGCSDVNLEVRDGELLSIVGPSGCGKTTTLRIIAGLEQPTAGELYFDDRRMQDVLPQRRNIAMVFQSYALYPHMTVHDNMSYGLKVRKTPKDVIESKVEEASRLLGIGHLLSRKPSQLSGGERQRVALGRAIVRNPDVFLLDEPLSNIDAKLRVQMREELAKLHQILQVTMIYVTHDQLEAMTISDRIAVMNGGMVQQIGEPLDVYNQPANAFVAGFVGTPPINLIAGSVLDHGESAVLSLGSIVLPIQPRQRAPLLRVPAYPSVLVGVRPEDVYVDEVMRPHAFDAVVTSIQPIGPSQVVALEAPPGIRLTSSVDPDRRFTIGQRVRASFSIEKLHFFDPQSNQRTT